MLWKIYCLHNVINNVNCMYLLLILKTTIICNKLYYINEAQFVISLFSIKLKHEFLESYLSLIDGLIEGLSNGFIEHSKLSIQMMEKASTGFPTFG